MPSCCGFGAAVTQQFTEQKAAQELSRYRTRGPGRTTTLLLDGLTNAGLVGGSLLDVGAGVGALTFELLDRGVGNAVAVDASAAYLAAAKDEATRRARLGAASFVHGDFVDVADQLPIADTVTLDRVVCCYPDHESLLAQALRHAARGFAFTYPRDRWFVRWGVGVENALRRLRANPFRTVVHSATAMERIIHDEGFELVNRSQTVAWSADVYRRPADRA